MHSHRISMQMRRVILVCLEDVWTAETLRMSCLCAENTQPSAK